MNGKELIIYMFGSMVKGFLFELGVDSPEKSVKKALEEFVSKKKNQKILAYVEKLEIPKESLFKLEKRKRDVVAGMTKEWMAIRLAMQQVDPLAQRIIDASETKQIFRDLEEI